MKGFTLIELIVVVSIIVIVSVGMAVNYFSFDSRQKLRSEARELVSLIDRARTMATVLEYPTGCSGLEYYSVKSILDTGKFEILVKCSSGEEKVMEIEILKSTKITAPLSITFAPQTGYITGGEEVQIVLQDKNNSQMDTTITVNPLAVGNIKIEE